MSTILIDGQWRSAVSGQTIEVINPCDGKPFTTIARGTSADIDLAVAAAQRLARPGDAVLLSPACASFDWYPTGGYPARGDDFKRAVGALLAGAGR